MKCKWLLFVSAGFLTACSTNEITSLEDFKTREMVVEMKEADPKFLVTETTITLGAIGDVLLHDRVYERQETEPGVFDFDPALEAIVPLLEVPDYVMANQESVPGGVEFGLSAYPSFNSPQEIVYSLKDAGVDMIVAANNHTIDRGIPPLMSALDLYDELELPYVGAYRDTADRNDFRVIDIEGVSVGVLSYTFSTNGIPIPAGYEDSVAMIEERVLDEVEQIRSLSDVVVVHMHWGNEYERLPNDFQTSWAERLAEADVDVVFGHHPHVLQPVDTLEQPDGGEMVVFYSLGNFYSGQNFDHTDVGGLGTVDVTKRTAADGTSVKLSNAGFVPTQVVRGPEREYITVPMEEAGVPSIAGETAEETVDHVMQWIVE